MKNAELFFFPKETRFKTFKDQLTPAKRQEIAVMAMKKFVVALVNKYPKQFETAAGVKKNETGKLTLQDPEAFATWLFTKNPFFSEFHKFVKTTELKNATPALLKAFLKTKEKSEYQPYSLDGLTKLIVYARNSSIHACYPEKDTFYNTYIKSGRAQKSTAPTKPEAIAKSRNSDLDDEDEEDESDFQPEAPKDTKRKASIPGEVSPLEVHAEINVEEEPVEVSKPFKKRNSRQELSEPSADAVPAHAAPIATPPVIKMEPDSEKIARYEEQIRILQAQSALFDTAKSELGQKVVELSAENVQLARSVENLQRQKAGAERRAEGAEAREYRLRADLDKERKVIDSQVEMLQQHEADLDRIRAERSTLKEELAKRNDQSQQVTQLAGIVVQLQQQLQQQLLISLQQRQQAPQSFPRLTQQLLQTETIYNASVAATPTVEAASSQSSWSASMFRSTQAPQPSRRNTVDVVKRDRSWSQPDGPQAQKDRRQDDDNNDRQSERKDFRKKG